MICEEPKLFPIEALREFCTRVFVHFGCPREDAEHAADVLACADLRGIDSHGIARLHSYFELLSADAINPKPSVEIARSTLSTATVDGDNGLGLVVGAKANVIAMDLAGNAGTGWVSVRNTNHFGIAGYYVLKALEHYLLASLGPLLAGSMVREPQLRMASASCIPPAPCGILNPDAHYAAFDIPFTYPAVGFARSRARAEFAHHYL